MENFSYYNGPITNRKPLRAISLTDVAAIIREDPDICTQITNLRAAKTKDQQERIKKKLPYVTFSGEFSHRKAEALLKHSGLFCVDLDNAKAENMNGIIPALHFVSPRGTGQKIVYSVDITDGTHIEYYFALEGYFKEVHNINIDQACKDIPRACFLSHDPDVVLNDSPSILGREFIKKYTKEPGEPLGFVPGNRNNFIFQKATEMAVTGITEKELLDKLTPLAQADFPKTEITEIVKKVIKQIPQNIPFIRVGVNHFKVVTKTDRHGIKRQGLKTWNKDTIIQDHGRKYLKYVPKYDDFCMVPDNINHKQVINGCYNLYAPFSHKPREGDTTWSYRLMEHVFGEQLAQGLRYMQILYQHPDRSTVILALVSKENKTGKTTFCNWLHMLFGQNVALLSSSDFTSGFNSAYATKNLIVIEETLLEKRLTIEKLKALVTSKHLTVNEKYVAPYNIPFHGKVILTSNNVDKFALIDPHETRFFVRKLDRPKFKNTAIEEDLLREIPAFLHYLQTLPPVDWSTDRSGFMASEIANENLRAVVDESRSGLYKELKDEIADYFDNNNEVDLMATPKDIKRECFYSNNRVDNNYIRRVLKVEFEMATEKLQRYTPFNDLNSKVGRPFKFMRSDFVTEDFDDKEPF